MTPKLIHILLIGFVYNCLAQSSNTQPSGDLSELDKKMSAIEDAIQETQNENNSLKSKYFRLKKNYTSLIGEFNDFKNDASRQIDSLKNVTSTNTSLITTSTESLGLIIDDTKRSTNQEITSLDKLLHKRSIYWIISGLIFGLAVVLVFVLLKKQLSSQKNDLENNLQNTRKTLEEEGVKLDNKLIEVLETQFKIINSTNSKAKNSDDHTLALKVADEIIRIQKNLKRMDEKTKGLKQLNASINRMRDNFASNGYELVEMLGKPYNEGMKVSATFINDEELEKGKQIISRIIKPQVNYNNIMIQPAQIEVSQNE